MLEDLTGELVWTRLLRTPALALRPSRLLMGMVAAFLASIIGRIPLGSGDRPNLAEEFSTAVQGILGEAARSVRDLSPLGLGAAVRSAATLPGRLMIERPLETSVLGLLITLVFVLFGGAIARGTAVEFATARFTDWPTDLRASLRKFLSSAGAVIAPLALVGVLTVVIALGGLLIGVPLLDVVAGLLYAIALLIALACVCLLLLHALALPMLVPAMMCEGTDAFDAAQRCYAYIIGRPLRLLGYVALLLLVGSLAIAVSRGVGEGAVHLTDWAASAWTSDSGVEVLEGSDKLTATQPVAAALINAWRALLELVLAGYAVSLFFASGAVLYLAARRVCDGQEINELWDPASDSD